jgi:hypothetical protein
MRYPLPAILTVSGPEWGAFELPNGEPVDDKGTRSLLALLVSERFRAAAKERGFEVVNIDRGESVIETDLPIELLEELANDAFESVWTDLDDGEVKPVPLQS